MGLCGGQTPSLGTMAELHEASKRKGPVLMGHLMTVCSQESEWSGGMSQGADFWRERKWGEVVRKQHGREQRSGRGERRPEEGSGELGGGTRDVGDPGAEGGSLSKGSRVYIE